MDDLHGMLRGEQASLATVVELLDEMLDANIDTALLAGDVGTDVAWLSHLDYLRALYRHGEAVLARIP